MATSFEIAVYEQLVAIFRDKIVTTCHVERVKTFKRAKKNLPVEAFTLPTKLDLKSNSSTNISERCLFECC